MPQRLAHAAFTHCIAVPVAQLYDDDDDDDFVKSDLRILYRNVGRSSIV